MSSTSAIGTNSSTSSSLKPKLEEESSKKHYEEKDVIYHIAGVETCFIDLHGGNSSLIPLSQDDDLYVILCPPEGVDDPVAEGLPEEILYLKAGRISCPLSPNQPTMRKTHQEVRLAYLFPMEIAVEENPDEVKFLVFAVILPATFEWSSPIVLGFEDLLHKFTLFTLDEEEDKPVSDKQLLEGAPALPKSVDQLEVTDWDVVYTIGPVHCCVIDLEAMEEDDDEEDPSELEEEQEGSYELGQSKVNVLLFPAKELVAVQVATKTVLLRADLVVKRKFYEDERLVYFFPFYEKVDEEDEDESELVLTVVLSPELTESSPEVIGFEDLLHKFAQLIIEEMEIVQALEGEEVDPNAPIEYPKPELAIKIEKTGYKVRTAIVKAGVKMGKGIFWTSNYINKHVRPNQKPTKVSPKTMARIYNARVVSGKVFGTSVKTLNMWNIGYKKVGSLTVGLWAKSPLYKKLTAGATTKNQAAVRDLFAAGSEAVMGLFYGLKDAGRILGECSKAATVNVVRHKWGEEAGYAAQESLNVVRDLALAGWYSYNAFTPSWQQILREGSYELFDQLSNFRNWISARVLRFGTIYFKIPLLISSNYSVRFLVMTEEALVVFYDKEHYLRSMTVAFPDRTEIFEAALRGDVVVRDWRPGMKIPGVESTEEKKKKRKRRKKAKEGAAENGETSTKDGETTENGETSTKDGEATTKEEEATTKEGEASSDEKKSGDESKGEAKANSSSSDESDAKDKSVPVAAVITSTAVPAEEENTPSELPVEAEISKGDSVTPKTEESEAESSTSTPGGNEDEMPQLEPTPTPDSSQGFATPVPPPKKYKSRHGNPLEVRELSSVDKTSFKRSGFSSIKDIKVKGKQVKTKNFYRKAYMYVAAMPLEEMDYVRYEDESVDVIQRHSRPYCFCIQSRDGTWTYYSADTYIETTDWVEELNKWVVYAKEKRGNKFAPDEMSVDNPNLPKFSDHDYISWLPKEMAKPASLPSAMEVQLLPKKMLSSTEMPREVHEGKDYNIM